LPYRTDSHRSLICQSQRTWAESRCRVGAVRLLAFDDEWQGQKAGRRCAAVYSHSKGAIDISRDLRCTPRQTTRRLGHRQHFRNPLGIRLTSTPPITGATTTRQRSIYQCHASSGLLAWHSSPSAHWSALASALFSDTPRGLGLVGLVQTGVIAIYRRRLDYLHTILSPSATPRKSLSNKPLANLSEFLLVSCLHFSYLRGRPIGVYHAKPKSPSRTLAVAAGAALLHLMRSRFDWSMCAVLHRQDMSYSRARVQR
jgi:hypothetical protein